MAQYLLEGRALALGREIDSLYESLSRKRKLLEEQAAQEWDTFSKRQNQQIQTRMDELGEILGLERENGPVHLDGSYLEQLGIMILVQEHEQEEPNDELVASISDIISTAVQKKKRDK